MQSLQALMRQLERSPEWQSTALLRQLGTLWPEVVGAAVAQHSRPTKVYRDVLQVAVSSAAWAQTLTFERALILQKIHQKLPKAADSVKDIRFAAASWQQVTRTTTPPRRLRNSLHPSWVASPGGHHHAPAKTAEEAFQRLAQRQQARLASQPRCPTCGCPCPAQELERWPACAICMTHQWQTISRK